MEKKKSFWEHVEEVMKWLPSFNAIGAWVCAYMVFFGAKTDDLKFHCLQLMLLFFIADDVVKIKHKQLDK